MKNKIPKSFYLILIIAVIAMSLVIFTQSKLPANQESQSTTQIGPQIGAEICPHYIWFEGWETVRLGNPPCEVSLEGFCNCAFTADSGQWLVTELRDRDVPLGSPIRSVEILPGKKLKLKLTESGCTGHVTSRSMSIPLKPTTTISFTDHVAELGNLNYPSCVDMYVFFDAPGDSVPCPGTDFNVGDTYIRYIFETTPGYVPRYVPGTMVPCTATVNVGHVSAFSRNLYEDFVNLLPFSPDGWRIIQITLNVKTVPDIPSGIEPGHKWAVWDNIGISEEHFPPQTGTGMEIRVDSPADLHVYDPEGRHVGINYDTGEVEIEIPGATYSGPSSEPQVIHIPDPIGGSYKIKLVGIETGDYTLTIKGFIGENEISTVSYTGSINPGQVYESTATVSAIAGALAIDTTEPELIIIQGDFDFDGDVDLDDLNILLTYRNQPASACPACDLDGDGVITVLDARKLVLLCTRPRCATE